MAKKYAVIRDGEVVTECSSFEKAEGVAEALSSKGDPAIEIYKFVAAVACEPDVRLSPNDDDEE